MWSLFPGTKNHCFVSIFKIMVAEVPHPFTSISIYPKMNSCSTVFRCSIVARSLPANRAIMRNEKPTQLPFPFTSIICFELNYRFSLLIFDAFSGIWCKWTEERTSKQMERVSLASSIRFSNHAAGELNHLNVNMNMNVDSIFQESST